MSPRLDLAGRTFSRLKVLKLSSVENGRSHWACICECGNAIVARGNALTTGNTRSCGCLSVETVRARRTKHGASIGGPSKEYRAWLSVLERCLNKNSKSYPH